MLVVASEVLCLCCQPSRLESSDHGCKTRETMGVEQSAPAVTVSHRAGSTQNATIHLEANDPATVFPPDILSHQMVKCILRYRKQESISAYAMPEGINQGISLDETMIAISKAYRGSKAQRRA